MELFSYKIKKFLYFWKCNFLALYFSYISGSNFLSLKNEKNTLLKCLLYFKIAPSKNTFSKMLPQKIHFKIFFQTIAPSKITFSKLFSQKSLT